MQLFDPQGHRLYLTPDERAVFLNAAKDAERSVRTFCTVLHYTGCRISEALALTPDRVDFNGKALIFETLKERRPGIYRAVPVPVPDEVLDTLNMVHGLKEGQKRKNNSAAKATL